VSDALDRVAQRTGSEDLSWVVMAVRIQRDVGGNLAEILQTSVDTMRERARLRRHVRSLSAEGRLSAWVLICVPLVLGTFHDHLPAVVHHAAVHRPARPVSWSSAAGCCS
jgi:tight adherence protein B